MSESATPKSDQLAATTTRLKDSGGAGKENDRHLIFRIIWYMVSFLLILALVAAFCSTLWEYSTRRYLKGFSDAVVPESSSTEEKVEAIVNWMMNGPARLRVGPYALPDRDPTDTLNYTALLQVCGTATNAFLNLANSSGVPVRRLLLVDKRGMTKHVVAEVLVEGRWIVVDPAFRLVPRGRSGELLTREDLASPDVLALATRNLPNYSAGYTYDLTVHIRLARIPLVGRFLWNILDHLFPSWQDSTTISLLLERRSFAAMVLAIASVMFLIVLRGCLRWYGEHRMGLRPVRIRQQMRRALHALLHASQ